MGASSLENQAIHIEPYLLPVDVKITFTNLSKNNYITLFCIVKSY